VSVNSKGDFVENSGMFSVEIMDQNHQKNRQDFQSEPRSGHFDDFVLPGINAHHPMG
jgi:hypothetical protein